MTVDMSQFTQLFFEEASENLSDMENLLLAITVDQPDFDDLDAIFRSAHSIKGSAGTFGFHDMTHVTHELETLLDKLRKKELILTTDMVDAFLDAGDILKCQLTAHQSDETVEQSRVDDICQRLQLLAGDNTSTETTKTNEPNKTEGQTYDIHFTLDESVSLESVFAELRGIGKLHIISGAPNYLLQLSTSAKPKEIHDNFSFALDDNELSIEITNEDDIFLGATEDDQKDAPVFSLFDQEIKAVKRKSENLDPTDDSTKQQYLEQDTVNTENDSKELLGTKPKEKAAQADSSIRVNTEKVDLLINQVGELVITQAMLAQTVSNVDPVEYENLVNGMEQLERNTRDLQESVMSIRMMPISFVFGRFPRVVRDLANKLNKKIKLALVGESTELDKGLVEKLADPLTHLIRNSIDHGIELPNDRIAAGKDPQGTITLRAFHQGSNVVIHVNDDGGGLNREKILEIAEQRGLDANNNMSNQEVYKLIFSPGFSTAEKITSVSGRGVGMDVVIRNIKDMGGTVDIDSQPGQGSTISIKLPLTLAIVDGMSIAVKDQIYIIPLTFISESLQAQKKDIKTVSGESKLIKVRDEYLPLFALHKIFNIDTDITNPEEGILVLIEANGKKVALLVDELIGQHQVVLKSLECNYRKVPHISGATIMGDGRVALILDLASIVEHKPIADVLKACG